MLYVLLTLTIAGLLYVSSRLGFPSASYGYAHSSSDFHRPQRGLSHSEPADWVRISPSSNINESLKSMHIKMAAECLPDSQLLCSQQLEGRPYLGMYRRLPRGTLEPGNIDCMALCDRLVVTATLTRRTRAPTPASTGDATVDLYVTRTLARYADPVCTGKCVLTLCFYCDRVSLPPPLQSSRWLQTAARTAMMVGNLTSIVIMVDVGTYIATASFCRRRLQLASEDQQQQGLPRCRLPC